MIPLYVFILIPIFFGVTAYLFASYKIFKNLSIIVEIVLFAAGIFLFWGVKNDGVLLQNIGGWDSYIGITLRADLLSCVLMLLTIFIFSSAIIFNYSKPYVDKRFLFLLLVWQSLITGLFLSNDIFNIYVLIDVSTIIVSMLIMYKKDSRSMYDGIMYLLLNMVAAMFILLGIGFLYKLTNVLDIYGIAEKIKVIDDPSSLIIPYSLIISGVCFKAALVPLFTWLPKAHGTPGAPSIISAILSGLYVKVGVYMFIRMRETFSPVIDTDEIFIVISFITGVLGFTLALCQKDIKLILAYSTISQIGLIMMGLTSASASSYWGGVYHIINHSFFKMVLFLTAGMIVDEYKTRDITKIRGVLFKMPVVGVATFLAVLGVTGAPLFSGSISKYFIQSGFIGGLMEYGLIFINLGTIIVFINYSTILFRNKNVTRVKTNAYRNAVVIVLSVICFLGGIFGQAWIGFFFNQTVSLDITEYLQKALIFFLSLSAGFVIYSKGILKIKCLYRIERFDLSFNNACFAIVIFCAIMIGFLAVKYVVFA